jgi:hypothetical protein
MAVATGAAVMTLAAPAGAAAKPTVTVTPHAQLANNQIVTVSEKGLKNPSSGDGLTVGECSPAVLTSMDALSDCNLGNVGSIPAGKTKTTTFKIVEGSSYSDADKNKCDPTHSCVIVVTDNPLAPTEFASAKITFTNKVLTTTSVSSKKKVAKGKKLTFTAKTTKTGAAKLSGTVTFTGNGKKLGKVKETKSGKVTFSHKFKKAGKVTIKATYSGNKHFTSSSASKKITVKK